MTKFKIGDTVRLKREFYKLLDFADITDKGVKKAIGRTSGKSFQITDINKSDDECRWLHGFIEMACTDSGCLFQIPTSLLELANESLIKANPAIFEYGGEQYRKVKRWAVPGDLVLVVDSDLDASNEYKNGDVLSIVRTNYFYRPHYKNKYGKYLKPSEYVVLEPLEQKHKWTAEQIQEAKEITYRLMTSTDALTAIHVYVCDKTLFDPNDEPNRTTRHVIARKMYVGNLDRKREEGRAVAICSDNDEWCPEVGRMVAISKLLGEKLPAWVNGTGGAS